MDYGDRPQMVFGEVRYPQEYDDVHAEMVALIRSQFSHVEAGLQGDSWIWILDGDKVAIDTFSSMKHQVKSCTAGSHVQRVIDALRARYDVQVFDPPIESWS